MAEFRFRLFVPPAKILAAWIRAVESGLTTRAIFHRALDDYAQRRLAILKDVLREYQDQ